MFRIGRGCEYSSVARFFSSLFASPSTRSIVNFSALPCTTCLEIRLNGCVCKRCQKDLLFWASVGVAGSVWQCRALDYVVSIRHIFPHREERRFCISPNIDDGIFFCIASRFTTRKWADVKELKPVLRIRLVSSLYLTTRHPTSLSCSFSCLALSKEM